MYQHMHACSQSQHVLAHPGPAGAAFFVQGTMQHASRPVTVTVIHGILAEAHVRTDVHLCGYGDMTDDNYHPSR